MSDHLQEPFAFVIFGASGDLSRRKLIPALFHLADLGYMPERYAVVGMSRTPMSDKAFREWVNQALQDHRDEASEPTADTGRLAASVYYQAGDVTSIDGLNGLKTRLDDLDKRLDLRGNRLFYFAVAPDLVPRMIENLHKAGMLQARDDNSWIRIVFEKPFGHDLASARELNNRLSKVLRENQIFRIDHYLGKETVQNILAFRFANSIFEPIFNRIHVHHIHILVAETVGMEGKRGAYYDTAGALRDIVQNHALQLLCLTTMEPPPSFDAEAIRDEKVKVLRSLPVWGVEQAAAATIRGQYRGYRSEEGVDSNSNIETYVAVRTTIDNWRWSGVPIILETGKRLKERLTEIQIEFNQPPLCLFRQFAECPPNPNTLIIRIQPNEGIRLSFACKQPGIRFAVEDVKMDFSYRGTFGERSPEAYERLLLDALRGDASLFTRSDEVEMAWRFVSAIEEAWQAMAAPVFPNYEPATRGPAEINRLLKTPHNLRQ
jgi:glucose-6-phosphate 1-dehydrogenase